MRYKGILQALVYVLCFSTVSAAQSAGSSTNPHVLTGKERLHWTIRETIGTRSLAAGVWSAGWGTAFNNPPEYGTQWPGFAKRYGMRLTGVVTSNSMEAGLGALWGEDPRYKPLDTGALFPRMKHAAHMTFFAYRADGRLVPAYARYAGVTGNNFLSNTWRVQSESSVGDALYRTGLGFAGRFAGNAFQELWRLVR